MMRHQQRLFEQWKVYREPVILFICLFSLVTILAGSSQNVPPLSLAVETEKVDIGHVLAGPGTIVLYRQPTVWERYQKYIVAGLILIVLQALLIIGLLWQRGRKQKAEASLHESEKRFRAIAATTPSLLWICGKDGKVTYLNDRRVDFTGRRVPRPSGDTGKSQIWGAPF